MISSHQALVCAKTTLTVLVHPMENVIGSNYFLSHLVPTTRKSSISLTLWIVEHEELERE